MTEEGLKSRGLEEERRRTLSVEDIQIVKRETGLSEKNIRDLARIVARVVPEILEGEGQFLELAQVFKEGFDALDLGVKHREEKGSRQRLAIGAFYKAFEEVLHVCHDDLDAVGRIILDARDRRRQAYVDSLMTLAEEFKISGRIALENREGI